MPFDPATGLFTRTANSFSDPVFGTEIDPTDATSLFNDYDTGLGNPIQIVTASPVVVTATDCYLLINKTVGSATAVTLPTSVTKTKPIMVADIKGDAQANNITVTFTGGQLCQGQASFVINSNYGSITFYPLSTGGWYLDAASSSMPIWTLRGNPTAAVALESNFTIDGLTNKASPAAGDELIIWDVSGTAIKKCSVSSISSAGSVSSIAGNTGAFTLTAPITNATNAIVLNATVTPQGRLTLATATPVMTTSQSGKTTIFYTPYLGNLCPIYDGTNFIPTAFSELSNITTNSAVGSAGPAAVTTNSNYDLFVWAGPTLTRGPLWTSDTGRGTGAGTSELVRVNGIWLNANDITNGPAAQRGTYVGTVRSDGSSQINWTYGALASGGTAGVMGVWNMYNRVDVSMMVRDTLDSWTYNVAAWRAPNGNATMRVSMIRGIDEDSVRANYVGFATAGAAMVASAGVGVDSTTAFSGTTAQNFASAVTALPCPAAYEGTVGLGWHFITALEYNSGVTNSTWYGDTGNPTYTQSGLRVAARC